MQLAPTLHHTPDPQRRADAWEQTDEVLIQSVAQGGNLALRALYARHNVRVYRFVLRFTRDESLAEDIVSEVFLDVWNSAGSFKFNSQVTTWLLAIARNKAIAAHRQGQFAELDETPAEAIVDQSDNPERILQKDRSAQLQDCLTELPPIHREIFDLVYYHMKSIQEVAEIIDIPLNTVKNRMLCARNGLTQLLKQAGVERAYA